MAELIYADNPGAVPAPYVLPPGLELTVQSVSAEFNGAGAGATFYPCLSVYSQNGKLVGRFFPSQALAVSDSGEVTYGPFLGGQTGGRIGPLPTLLDYVELQANVTTTSTDETNPTAVLSANPLTFDGLTNVEIVASVQMDNDMRGNPVAGSGGDHVISLWDNTTNLGALIDLTVSGIYQGSTMVRSVRVTPTAGVHTFALKSWKAHGAGVGFPTCIVYAAITPAAVSVKTNLAVIG